MLRHGAASAFSYDACPRVPAHGHIADRDPHPGTNPLSESPAVRPEPVRLFARAAR
jgi:hypothetical protein